MKKFKIFFWFILAVTVFFTRFYKLTLYPPSLSIDEVSIGYNAFSILKTGKDEWGTTFPVSFKSVGDYKAPVLIYLTVPFIKLLGLSELSTRLPVALFSALSIYFFWLLVSRYIFSKKYPFLSYLSTAIYALSPWLIIYSRSGFEAVLALNFLLINLIFAFELRRHGRLSSFFFMFFFAYLSAITYHSTKIVAPLLNISFILLDYRYFLKCLSGWYQKCKSLLFITTILFFGITVFFIANFILGPGASRAKMTFLTQDFDYARVMLPVLLAHPYSWFTSVFGLLSFWLNRYFQYFSANFYLSSGLGLATFGQPDQGVIYTIEYPFLIIGFFVLLTVNKYFASAVSSKFVPKILTTWFLLGFLPASLTNNIQHSLRSLNNVPVIAILIAVGLSLTFELLKKKLFKWLFVTLVIIGYMLGMLRFVDYYTLHYPVELSETRSFGWKQMAIFARDHHSEYDKVYVDDRFGTQGPYTYGLPYLYFLFYSQYDPNIYVNSPLRKEGNTNFENYIFTEINWPDIDHTQHNLYIASPWSFPQEILNTDKQKDKVLFLNQASGLYAISD
jgi:hypothetical protein